MQQTHDKGTMSISSITTFPLLVIHNENVPFRRGQQSGFSWSLSDGGYGRYTTTGAAGRKPTALRFGNYVPITHEHQNVLPRAISILDRNSQGIQNLTKLLTGEQVRVELRADWAVDGSSQRLLIFTFSSSSCCYGHFPHATTVQAQNQTVYRTDMTFDVFSWVYCSTDLQKAEQLT